MVKLIATPTSAGTDTGHAEEVPGHQGKSPAKERHLCILTSFYSSVKVPYYVFQMFRFSGGGFITNLKTDSNLMESFDNVTKVLTL